MADKKLDERRKKRLTNPRSRIKLEECENIQKIRNLSGMIQVPVTERHGHSNGRSLQSQRSGRKMAEGVG